MISIERPEGALAERPWYALYGGDPRSFRPARDNMLDLFRAAVAVKGDGAAAIYFDRTLSYRELDGASEALAAWLLDSGVVVGDRVAIILQNDPQFLIAILAAWKVGAVPVPINPMYRSGELKVLFADASPRILFCYSHDLAHIGAAVDESGIDATVVQADPRHFQSRNDARVLPPQVEPASGYSCLGDLLDNWASRTVPAHAPRADDHALLLYTSGTTGVPKGALSRHSALAFNSSAMNAWCRLHADARILAIAPLFHITGIVCHVAAAISAKCSLILNYRFEAGSVLDAIRSTRPTYSIGAITAYNALMNAPGACADDFTSFESIYSGGAPIPPTVRAEFKARTGVLIHTSYGMTETSAPTHMCPFGVEAPVDPESGALSIGIPIYETDAMVVDEDGYSVPLGTAGELWSKGPQIMLGYWNKPEETAVTLTDGWMHSGDIAVTDKAGWFYLVDRKKDVIIASGFKVWPREVEDVLYGHSAVREAAVVGLPDPYRGETVKAYVSLKSGERACADDLIGHCRAMLASYKAPTHVEILDELPKTVTGKIQRNVLREQAKQDAR